MTTFKALAAIFGLIIIGIIILVLGNQTPIGAPTSSTTNGSFEMQSSITKSPTEENVNIYTSPTLGITFKFPINDPMLLRYDEHVTVWVKETDNTISANGGSVTVFEKNPQQSFKDAVRALVFDKNVVYKNCSLQAGEPWNASLDQTMYLATATGEIEVIDDRTSDCPSEYVGPGKVFAASSQYPDRFVLISYATQEPADALYVDENNMVTKWESTIELAAR